MEYLDVDIKCKILLVATEVVKAKQMLKSGNVFFVEFTVNKMFQIRS